MRLDEFLISENLATSEQVREALDYQRAYGDRLETHLFRFGYVSEADLVGALSRQFCYPGVCLSGLEISDDVLRLLSVDAVSEKQVIPFEYDAAANLVKIACENPRQGTIREELADLLPGRTIELFLALGVTLRLTIAKYYRCGPMPEPPSVPTETDETTSETPELAEDGPPLVAASVGARRNRGSADRPCRLTLLDIDDNAVSVLGRILRYQGYHVTTVRSGDGLVAAVAETQPDILLLVMPGDRAAINDLVERLARRDLSVAGRPTFLVTDGLSDEDIGELLRDGFEDIVPSENMLDLLMIKLGRVRERLASDRARRTEIIRDLGTHGSLQDMNVIDLLQAMGPIGKTVRISVSGDGHQLTIFLDQGRLIYAECEDARGADAVYRALGWKRGVWSVDPVIDANLPEPNNDLTNEALLLEGCRRLDETGRFKLPAPVGDDVSFFEQFD